MKVVNFRDLGGIVGADGRKVKPKKILRSGELVGLSEASKRALLEDYELKTVIDLRSERERIESPNDDMPVETVHLDILKVAMEDNKASLRSMSAMKTVEESVNGMTELYRFLISSPQVRKVYRAFVDVFLHQEEGAVLFHCFAGKDRTGLGAAFMLSLLGVSEEDIMTDYLRTNELRREANEAYLAERNLTGEAAEVMLVGLNVQEEYMRAAMEGAVQEFGSFAAFCKNGIGVSEEEIELLRAKCLEK